MNLLKETIARMKANGKTPEDVSWVGSKDGKYAMEWGDFAKISADVEYDNGFGAQEVATDLVVVGDGWWMERKEYDGSEYWDFKSAPTWTKNPMAFTKVSGGMWVSVETLNTEKSEEWDEERWDDQ